MSMATGGARYKQGVVAESKPGFARVRFDDVDGLVTAWLPLLHPPDLRLLLGKSWPGPLALAAHPGGDAAPRPGYRRHAGCGAWAVCPLLFWLQSPEL